MSRAGTFLAFVLLSGCGATDPVEVACGGPRPLLVDCTPGLYDADCGGSGEPTFACGEHTGCRWFATGCVPSGYHTSDCPAGDLCCHTTADGEWPFADGWTAEGFVWVSHVIDIAVVGGGVVAPEAPENLALTVDPDYIPSAPGVTCAGEVAWQLCDGLTAGPYVETTDAGTVVIRVNPRLYGQTVRAELVPQPDRAPIARAFVGYQNDYVFETPATCSVINVPGLGPVTGGSITTTSLDGSAHGVLTLPVEGGTVTVRF